MTIRSSWFAAVAVLLVALFTFGLAFSAQAETATIDFESYSIGSINGQNGWSSTGSFDQGVVDATVFGYSGQAFRISNAVTSGAFGNQTFAAPLTDSAGETIATAGAYSTGSLQNHFEVQFDIASASTTEQPGLIISVSPDRGDGSRMSFLRFEDSAGGINVNFFDVQSTGSPANFVPTMVATGLSHGAAHTVKLTFDALEGPSNDVVRVYIDGSLVHTGTSWENYFRYDAEASAEQTPRIIKTLLIRAGGTATPATMGEGFLFDNLQLTSSASVAPSTVYVNSAYSTTIGATTPDNHTVGVDAFSTLSDALNAVAANGTINLASDLTVSSQVTIEKAVTINGNDFTISPSFTFTGNDNNSSIGILSTSDVTINDLTIEGSGGTNLHGINIFESSNVMLNSIISTNNDKSGINVNASTVTVADVQTITNGWGGINVDKGTTLLPATLTVNGSSFHDESGPAIWIDDNTNPDNSVVDTNTQYTSSNPGGTVTVYELTATKVKTSTATQETSTGGSVTVVVDIPADTIVTGDASWNGTIDSPTATTTTISIPGSSTNVIAAIAIGSSDSDLVFDKAVRMKFVGQSGNRIGWTNHAGTFTEITAACAATGGDNEAAQTAQLAAAGTCKFDLNGDLIIWTKHFSVFATFTAIENAPTPTSGGSGGGGGSNGAPVGSIGSNAVVPTGSASTPSTPSTGGVVLGAESFQFTQNLKFGMRSSDVSELQKFLVAKGYSIPFAVTTYFGPQTLAAVKAYQKDNGIPTTGFVGVLTRAALNK